MEPSKSMLIKVRDVGDHWLAELRETREMEHEQPDSRRVGRGSWVELFLEFWQHFATCKMQQQQHFCHIAHGHAMPLVHRFVC